MAETLGLYANRVENRLIKLLKQEPDWKAAAMACERMAVEHGLLPPETTPLPKDSPFAFALHPISEQDCVLENSNLMHLWERGWDPENAINPQDLVSHLLL